MEGLKLIVIGLLYSILIWILSLISIPIFTSDSGAANALGVLILLVEIVVALLLALLVPGGDRQLRQQRHDRFRFCVRQRSGASSRRTWAACSSRSESRFLAGMLVGIVAGILGIIPCIGWIAAWLVSFAAMFYILLVFAYNCGHIAKSS